MKFQVKGLLIAGALLVLAVFVGSAVLTYSYTRALIADQEWVQHTRNVLARIDSVQALISDAESAHRGYLLTGDARYLQPYDAAIKALPQELDILRGLTADNPEQQANITELDHEIAQKIAEMRLILSLQRRYGFEAARQEVLTDVGRTEMDDIRKLVAQMESSETALLQQRMERSQQTARHTLAAAVLSNTLGIILVAFVAAMIMRSVNDRFAAAQRLAESEEHLRLSLRSANAWSWQYDVRTAGMTRSQDISPFLGLPSGAIDNTLDSSLARYHPEDAERFRRDLAAAIENGEEFDTELRVIWPDGSTHWFAVRGRAVYDPHHRPVHVVGIDIEITDKKRSEEVMRETEKLASAGRLAATLAHEINNPLEAVNSIHYLLLRHANLDDESRRHLEMANEEMARVIEVIRNTLGLYRDATVPLSVDVAQVVDNVLSLFERTLRTRGIEVHRRYETEGRVFGYRGEIRQIFINLVGNALDAMSRGGRLTVHIAAAASWKNGYRPGVRVIIGDTGPGIPLEVRRRLFTPFFSTKGEKGTGLGLWVSRQLAEKHGGGIRLWSRTHGAHGTWFRVFLPSEENYAAVARR